MTRLAPKVKHLLPSSRLLFQYALLVVTLVCGGVTIVSASKHKTDEGYVSGQMAVISSKVQELSKMELPNEAKLKVKQLQDHLNSQ